MMNRIACLILILVLAACSSTGRRSKPGELKSHERDDIIAGLQAKLGMERPPDDLGFQEKSFNACEYGLTSSAGCQSQYFTVVHFQLLCRDSEGTVSEIPTIQPITSDKVLWQLAGFSGGTQTDAKGYGHLTMLSNRSIKNQRLILRIGPKFMGVSVDEVSKIVLPKNWCGAT